MDSNFLNVSYCFYFFSDHVNFFLTFSPILDSDFPSEFRVLPLLGSLFLTMTIYRMMVMFKIGKGVLLGCTLTT